MRTPHGQRLCPGTCLQLVFFLHRCSQDGVDQTSLRFATGKRDCFIDRGMFRRSQEEELIQTKPENIAKLDLNVRAPQTTDPKIEQGRIPEHAIEQFQGEAAVRCRTISVGQQP